MPIVPVCRSILMWFFLSCVTMFSNAQDVDQQALTGEAVVIVKNFAGQLKPQLQQALQSGGPVAAIQVCSQQAPTIAAQLSQESGWTVKRVSLKARNASTAVPDAWEREVLLMFDKLRAEGEAAESLVRAEIIDGNFRFIKAQPVEGLCLLCHGSAIAADVKTALTKYYPNDTATGYSLGDVRGAFSLTKTLTSMP